MVVVIFGCKKSDVQPQTVTKTVTDTVKTTKTDTVYVNKTAPSIYGTWKMVEWSQQVGSNPPSITYYSNATYTFSVDTIVQIIGINTNQYPITYGVNSCTITYSAMSIYTYTLTWDYKNQQYLMQHTYGAGPTIDTYYLK